MPRTGPRRPLVAIRLSDEGIRYVDQLALDEGVVMVVKGKTVANRSEMIRRLLAEALQARAQR